MLARCSPRTTTSPPPPPVAPLRPGASHLAPRLADACKVRRHFRGYARGQGIFYAKHLRAGDLTVTLASSPATSTARRAERRRSSCGLATSGRTRGSRSSAGVPDWTRGRVASVPRRATFGDSLIAPACRAPEAMDGPPYDCSFPRASLAGRGGVFRFGKAIQGVEKDQRIMR